MMSKQRQHQQRRRLKRKRQQNQKQKVLKQYALLQSAGASAVHADNVQGTW